MCFTWEDATRNMPIYRYLAVGMVGRKRRRAAPLIMRLQSEKGDTCHDIKTKTDEAYGNVLMGVI
jgi:hypothetical protein